MYEENDFVMKSLLQARIGMEIKSDRGRGIIMIQ